jgi:hypothetical protein
MMQSIRHDPGEPFAMMAPPKEHRPQQRKPKPSRRSRISTRSHGALSPGMRELYRHFVESGMSLTRYAKEWLGISRITVWSWFNNLSYPYPSTRAQIKARTGIEVGPR